MAAGWAGYRAGCPWAEGWATPQEDPRCTDRCPFSQCTMVLFFLYLQSYHFPSSSFIALRTGSDRYSRTKPSVHVFTRTGHCGEKARLPTRYCPVDMKNEPTTSTLVLRGVSSAFFGSKLISQVQKLWSRWNPFRGVTSHLCRPL